MAKRRCIWIVLLAFTGCHGQAAPTPFYLGQVGTLSGAGKGPGEKATLGLRLALEEAKAEENLGRPVVIRHADTGGQLEAFESLAARLVTVNKVSALFGGATFEEVNRLARGGVPLLTPSGLRPGGMDHVFSLGLARTFQGEILARFAADNFLKSRLVVLVDQTQEEFAILADHFLKEFAGKKGTLVPLRLTYGKDVKLVELGPRLVKEKAEAILLAGQEKDLSDLPAELRSPKTILLYGGLDGIWKNEANPWPGPVYFASAFYPDASLPKSQEFARKFKEAFKEEPDVHAALGYEAVSLLIEALKQTSKPTQDNLRQQLGQLKNIPGLIGPLSFESDRTLRRPGLVIRLEKGAFTLAKKYEP